MSYFEEVCDYSITENFSSFDYTNDIIESFDQASDSCSTYKNEPHKYNDACKDGFNECKNNVEISESCKKSKEIDETNSLKYPPINTTFRNSCSAGYTACQLLKTSNKLE